jgi:hypothetical protein
MTVRSGSSYRAHSGHAELSQEWAAGKSACRPGLVPGGWLTLANAGLHRADLRLRSQWFSSLPGRSRGDVPPMCPELRRPGRVWAAPGPRHWPREPAER